MADVSIMMAAHAGARVDIVATVSSSPRGTHRMARADRGVRGPADLVGKRIGYVQGTGRHHFTHVFLLFHGIDQDRLVQVPLHPADAPQRLARGEVDAAGLHPPHAFVAQQPLREQAAALPSPRLKLEPGRIDATLADFDFRLRLDRSLITTVEGESRWAAREGLAPKGPAPEFLARIRSAPLQALDPRAVSICR